MPLKKPRQNLRVAILVPTYGRPEYTIRCKEALEADKRDNYDIYYHPGEKGLRDAIIDFFEDVKGKYDILSKIDNDCIVPKDWMENILDVFEKTDADILSPNVYPSNAAFTYGAEGEFLRPAAVIGGLWVMKAEMIDDIDFERHYIGKIKGAIPILRQIVNIKDPVMGWVPNVIIDDIGHWSGKHPECIKSDEHRSYYREVGREIAW
ncbi:MAG: glycosyltransferase [Porphyromonadaceae bacterium]|nr:glycosyltransferase [Porphyromonadaceae bacterium]